MVSIHVESVIIFQTDKVIKMDLFDAVAFYLKKHWNMHLIEYADKWNALYHWVMIQNELSET